MRRALARPAKLLVRLPAWLGDCIMAEPVVRALLARASAAHPVTLAGSARIAAGLGWDRAPHTKFLALERGQSARVADWRGHDVALLLDGSWRSAITAARAGIAERIGFASGGRALLLTSTLKPACERGAHALGNGVSGARPRRLPRPFTSSAVELATLAALTVHDREPRIELDDAVIARVAERLARLGVSEREPGVIVHCGARPGSAKGVPVANWIAILNLVRERTRAPLVLVCAPGEEAPARAVAAALPEALLLADPPLDIAETAAVHRFARLALAPDGGAAHLARASSRVPLIVLFGPTDPRHVAEHRALVFTERVEVPCGPCHDELCRIKTPERDQCMRRLFPERIAERAVELLAPSA